MNSERPHYDKLPRDGLQHFAPRTRGSTAQEDQEHANRWHMSIQGELWTQVMDPDLRFTRLAVAQTKASYRWHVADVPMYHMCTSHPLNRTLAKHTEPIDQFLPAIGPGHAETKKKVSWHQQHNVTNVRATL